jgi:hypothetical protein
MSIAKHSTDVVPGWNSAPEGGVHEIDIGSVPPVVVGAGKLTFCTTPRTVMLAGQVITGGPGSGGITGL